MAEHATQMSLKSDTPLLESMSMPISISSVVRQAGLDRDVHRRSVEDPELHAKPSQCSPSERGDSSETQLQCGRTI